MDQYNERELPPKAAFFNTLTQTELSDQDYAVVKHVWDTLQLQCLGDLCHLYLALDIVHLCKS